MTDPFAGWTKVQDDVLKAQRAQIEAFNKLSSAAADGERVQKNEAPAAGAGLKALGAALSLRRRHK